MLPNFKNLVSSTLTSLYPVKYFIREVGCSMTSYSRRSVAKFSWLTRTTLYWFPKEKPGTDRAQGWLFSFLKISNSAKLVKLNAIVSHKYRKKRLIAPFSMTYIPANLLPQLKAYPFKLLSTAPSFCPNLYTAHKAISLFYSCHVTTDHP